MNYIWSGIIIISFIAAAVNGTLSQTLTAMLEGAKSSFTVLFSFAGIMCFWSGILKLAEHAGATEKCEKFLSPVINRLFPKVPDKKNITMNIIANLLGMGNAATPAGVAAMTELDKLNGENPVPSHEMCRFTVMNTAGLQLIPTTVIGILSAAGGQNPFSIVPYVWICSFISLFSALFIEWLTSKKG